MDEFEQKVLEGISDLRERMSAIETKVTGREEVCQLHRADMLSIKADIAATYGGKKYLIFSRNVSPEFTNMLQKSGNQLIFVSERDEPAKNMEKILCLVTLNYIIINISGVARHN